MTLPVGIVALLAAYLGAFRHQDAHFDVIRAPGVSCLRSPTIRVFANFIPPKTYSTLRVPGRVQGGGSQRVAQGMARTGVQP
jgi:hypothetical protein